MSESKELQNKSYSLAYFAISVGAGIAIGIAFDNLAIGIAIGLGLWPLISLLGRTLNKRRKKNDSSND